MRRLIWASGTRSLIADYRYQDQLNTKRALIAKVESAPRTPTRTPNGLKVIALRGVAGSLRFESAL